MNNIKNTCKFTQTCQNVSHTDEACRMKAIQYYLFKGVFVCPKCGRDEGIDFDTFVIRHPIGVCLNGFSAEKKRDAAKRRCIVSRQTTPRDSTSTQIHSAQRNSTLSPIQSVQRDSTSTQIQSTQRNSTSRTDQLPSNITTHETNIYNLMKNMSKKMDKLDAELKMLRKKVLVIPDTPQIEPVDVQSNKVRRVESVNHQIIPTEMFTNGKKMPRSKTSSYEDYEDSEENESPTRTSRSRTSSYEDSEENESPTRTSRSRSTSFGESEEDASNRPLTIVGRYQNVDIDAESPLNVRDIGFENLRPERQGLPIREFGNDFNDEASLLRIERRYRRKNKEAVYKSGLTTKKPPPF